MRVPRVFVRELRAGTVALAGGEAQYLREVLRLGPGARVRAFDGQGLEADGEVAEVSPMRLTLALEPPVPSEVEAALEVTLAVALLKGDKLAEVVRRGTELGAVRFSPFVSAHCDVRELSKNKLERCRRVAREAAKQSGRSVVPEVDDATCIEVLKLSALSVVAQPTASGTLQEVRARHPQAAAVTVVTGPEGGLREDEVAALRARGAHPIRLGARILRAETAPIAVAAALLIPEAL